MHRMAIKKERKPHYVETFRFYFIPGGVSDAGEQVQQKEKVRSKKRKFH